MGYDLTTVEVSLKKFFLVLRHRNLCIFKYTRSRKSNNYSESVFLNFRLKYDEKGVLETFLIYNNRPYIHIRISCPLGSFRLLSSGFFYSTFPIRIKSPKNINKISKNLDGAINLSSFPIHVDSRYSRILRSEIKKELESSLVKLKNSYGDNEVNDINLFDNSLNWWGVLNDRIQYFSEFNQDSISEGFLRVEIDDLNRRSNELFSSAHKAFTKLSSYKKQKNKSKHECLFQALASIFEGKQNFIIVQENRENAPIFEYFRVRKEYIQKLNV
jgi:hypothetical protein